MIIYNIHSKLWKSSKPNYFQSAKDNDDTYVDDGTILDPFESFLKVKQKVQNHFAFDSSQKQSHTRHELLCK